jgi:hypothetical protein
MYTCRRTHTYTHTHTQIKPVGSVVCCKIGSSRLPVYIWRKNALREPFGRLPFFLQVCGRVFRFIIDKKKSTQLVELMNMSIVNRAIIYLAPFNIIHEQSFDTAHILITFPNAVENCKILTPIYPFIAPTPLPTKHTTVYQSYHYNRRSICHV